MNLYGLNEDEYISIIIELENTIAELEKEKNDLKDIINYLKPDLSYYLEYLFK